MLKERRPINFELELLPIISVLAVCISFLLVTAVWMHLGSLNLSQALGSEASQDTSAAIWVEFSENGDLNLVLKGAQEKQLGEIKSDGRELNWREFQRSIGFVRQSYPKMNVALVVPKKTSRYRDIVRVIDEFKRINIEDVGIAPL